MIQETTQGAALSLMELNDAVLPPEVSPWPSAPGWTVVGAALLVALVTLATWLVSRHRSLRYRRAALAELRRIRATQQLEALPVLLKRVALAVYPRSEVAALSGASWTDWLDRTGGAGLFARGTGEALGGLAFGGARPIDATAVDELMRAVEAWIRAQGPDLESQG